MIKNKPGHMQPVGRPCGTWMHYAMRDVKDMGMGMPLHALCDPGPPGETLGETRIS